MPQKKEGEGEEKAEQEGEEQRTSSHPSPLKRNWGVENVLQQRRLLPEQGQGEGQEGSTTKRMVVVVVVVAAAGIVVVVVAVVAAGGGGIVVGCG